MLKLLRKFELETYLLAALMLVIPVYPKFPFIQIPGMSVFVRLEDFILLLVAIVAFFRLVKDKNLLKDKVLGAILLFVLVGFFSVLSGVFVTKTIGLNVGVLHWARRIEYFVPLVFALTLFARNKKNLNYVVFLVVISIALVFLVGLGQKYFNWPVIVTQSSESSKGIALRYASGSHLSSTFAGHYDMAAYLVATLPITISLFFVSKKKSFKVLIGVASLMGLWLLSNSLSRISVVAYLVATTTALFLIKKYKQIPIVILISVIAFGMSSSLLDRYMRIFEVTKDKVTNASLVSEVVAQGLPERQKEVVITPSPIPVFEDRSTSIRLNVEWPRALRAFRKNPLVGTGYSSITLATDNDWLRLLGEVGLLGFFAFLLIFARVFDTARPILSKISRLPPLERAFFAGFTGSMIGILANAVFIDVFEASKFAIIFWFLLGFYLNIVKKYEKV